jgi:hypothetical protein
MYKKLFTFDKNWTPIEQNIIKIQIGSNPIHTVTRIQFPIQLAIGLTIHYAKGLSFDCLAFDPSDVTKHDLTYTMLFCICSKKHLYLFFPLPSKNFHIDSIVE